MEDINLHFTGDMHAITTANNALSALIDNHLQQGNDLGIDQRRIIWKRVVDLNDRALRQVIVGLGGPVNGVPREDGFDITVASEIMAILCLATDLKDLKERLANIVIAYTYDRKPVYVRDLKVEGALTLILKDAIKPNLVQTIYGTPALVHGDHLLILPMDVTLSLLPQQRCDWQITPLRKLDSVLIWVLRSSSILKFLTFLKHQMLLWWLPPYVLLRCTEGLIRPICRLKIAKLFG